MKLLMIKTYLLLLFPSLLLAQSENSYVINAGGGNLQTENIGLTYFIGDYFGLGQAEGVAKLTNIEVYPNPLKSILKLSSPERQIDRIQIYSVNGIVLFDKKMVGNELDFSAYPPGIYLLKFKDMEGIESGSIKIIKQ